MVSISLLGGFIFLQDLLVCSDGTFYHATARCDSIDDCNDGSDENNCNPFPCKTGQGAVNGSAICDVIPYCADGSNEASCIQELDNGEHLQLNSRDYPNSYFGSTSFLWLFQANSSAGVNFSFVVTIDELHLDSYDTLKIGQGHDADGFTVVTFTGMTSLYNPYFTVVEGNKLFIEFVSGDYYDSGAFSIDIGLYLQDDLLVCSDGTLFSPTARCDSIDDCNDGSDENKCKYLLTVGETYVLNYNSPSGRPSRNKIWLFDINSSRSDTGDIAFFVYITGMYLSYGEELLIGSGFVPSNDSEFRFVYDDFPSYSTRRLIHASEMHVELISDRYRFLYFNVEITPRSLEGLFVCNDEFYAVNQSSRCDLSVDCQDFSDETDCVHTLNLGDTRVLLSPGYQYTRALWLFNSSAPSLTNSMEVAFIITLHYGYLYYGDVLRIGAGLVPNNDTEVFRWSQEIPREERILAASEMFIEFTSSSYYFNYYESQIEISLGYLTNPFPCKTGPWAVNGSAICDVTPDCTDGSDEASCIHELDNGEHLHLYSPNYPHGYYGNTSILWLFQANSSAGVNFSFVVTIDQLHLDTYDTLKIGQGHDADGFSVVNFIGFKYLSNPYITVVEGEYLFIEFVSDDYYSSGAFSIDIGLSFSDDLTDLLVCSDGTFYNSTARCDSIDDCIDGSDENKCKYSLTFGETFFFDNDFSYIRPYSKRIWLFNINSSQSETGNLAFFVYISNIYLSYGNVLRIGSGFVPSNDSEFRFANDEYLSNGARRLIQASQIHVELTSAPYSYVLFYLEITPRSLEGLFVCNDEFHAVNQSSRCDLSVDCPDSSDENDCEYSLTLGETFFLDNDFSYIRSYSKRLWLFNINSSKSETGNLAFFVYISNIYLSYGNVLRIGSGFVPSNDSEFRFANDEYLSNRARRLIQASQMHVELTSAPYSYVLFYLEITPRSLEGLFVCNDEFHAVNQSSRCDLSVDCPDSSDENDCVHTLYLGDARALSCPSYQFIHALWLFNSSAPALTNSMEVAFIITLHSGYLAFGDVLRIGAGLVPNSDSEVFRGSQDIALEERILAASEMFIEFTSSSYYNYSYFEIEISLGYLIDPFQCKTGPWAVNGSAICDVIPDCRDGSDEASCIHMLENGEHLHLYSPDYPNSYYGNSSILWLFQANSSAGVNLSFVVTIDELHLDNYDTLKIGKGHDADGITAVNFTGSTSLYNPYFTVVEGDKLFIEFVSDDYYDSGAFSIDIGLYLRDGQFICNAGSGKGLISMNKLCDGKVDCRDGTDETNCSVILATDEKVFLASFNYASYVNYGYEYQYSYSNWIVSSADSANALIVQVVYIRLYLGDSLIIRNSGAITNRRETTWSFADDTNMAWSDIADKVFPQGELLVEFQSLYYGGFGLEILALPLEDIITCDAGDKIAPPGSKCDGTVDCTDLRDELDCPPIESFSLSLGENVTIHSRGYPVYLPITRPLMKTWTFSAVDGTRLRLDIVHLQMESVDHFTLGTGFDIHNASTILSELSYDVYKGIEGKSLPPIITPGSEFWIAYFRTQGSLFHSSSFAFEVTAVQETEIQCPAGETICGDIFFECIDSTMFCDGVNDCIYGTDEECECPSLWEVRCGPYRACVNRNNFCTSYHSCEKDCTFACNNGQFIHQGFVCDGFNDCGDFTDERQDCECAAHQYDCGEKCIYKNSVCDRVIDCADGSDENNCSCQSFQFECASGECVNFWQLGDGASQCSDGSDEITENSRYCPGNYFQCHNFGNCLARSDVCDNYPHCADGSDEWFCSSDPQDEDVVLNTGECFNLTSPSYTNYYRYSNNLNYIWTITGAVGDSGIRMKFDVFSLESDFDFLEIGVGTYDGNYLYRFTGTTSIENQGIAESAVSASKALSDTIQEPESEGRKKRSVTSDFCSASTSYYDYGSFPYVIHLNSTKIWLQMTTDSSVVYEGFVLQLISTRFESESFECSDLSVIPADKKCDLIADCPSGNDEHECDIDIELSSEAWKNLTYQLAYSIHTVDVTWQITNTRGLSGYAVQVRLLQLGHMSSLVIGLGLDDSLTETRAVVLSPYSPLLELLFESEALWVRLHSYDSTDAAFDLDLRPAQFVGGPFLCSEGRVNISSNAICDGEKQCIDGNDERNCNHPILPEECGLRPALDVHRVTHGSEVTVLGEAPWQVALYDNSFGFICGGSIIANDWILTAAHCVEEVYGYSSYHIQAGTLTHDAAGQVHEVSEIYMHPLFGTYSLENDIALLKLSTPLNFTDAVQPVCLPTPGDHLPEVGSYVTFTGWGSFGERGGPLPRNLQKARAPVIPNNICQRPVRNFLRVFPSMFCTMYDTGYQSACTGDSGGPLVQEVNGRWTIYGITSWGLVCGEAYSPSGKTRVSSFIDFIYQTIREN